MTEIKSADHPMIKAVSALSAKKNREETNLLLVEGIHPVEEALQAGFMLRQLFHEIGKPCPVTLPSGAEAIQVEARLLKKMATTDSPPPCLATVSVPESRKIGDIVQASPLLVVLDRIQDPGNVGTLIRSAMAFGVDGMVVMPETADPYSPKVIRATAGLVFRCPMILEDRSLSEVLQEAQQRGYQVKITVVQGDSDAESYRTVDYTVSTMLVLGNEGAGVSAGGYPALTIPMVEGVESLNVAMSGAILMAEAFFQRQQVAARTF